MECFKRLTTKQVNDILRTETGPPETRLVNQFDGADECSSFTSVQGYTEGQEGPVNQHIGIDVDRFWLNIVEIIPTLCQGTLRI